jgi:hypothetical protein
MGVPRPEVDLQSHCSVVFNSTLYVYSPNAFQSIKLEEGGEWEKLTNGASVTGGVCVKAIPNGDLNSAALYIVGGKATDPSLSSYPGLQKFTFSNQSWEWVTPVVPVTQNRMNHAATFLNASQSIVVYAGSQSDSDTGPSSQTFAISIDPPYSVEAFTSSAPPGVNPMLIPWDDSHAVMLGGK